MVKENDIVNPFLNSPKSLKFYKRVLGFSQFTNILGYFTQGKLLSDIYFPFICIYYMTKLGCIIMQG